jgi:NADPH:quinone reductase-like Zn-dependent oxidoreductase
MSRSKALLDGASLDVITPDEEARSGPYDVIVDLVGGEDYLTRVTWLRRRGRLLMVGMLAPPPAAFPVERCSDAYHRLASPGKLGKIILTIELPPL